MSGEFTVSCVQFTAVDGEKQATIEKALGLVRQAGERGSQLGRAAGGLDRSRLQRQDDLP